MKVSSLKKTLPEAAFRKQNYLEHKGLFKCSSTLHVLSLFQLFSSRSFMHTRTHTLSLTFVLPNLSDFQRVFVEIGGLLWDSLPERPARNNGR